MVVFVRFCLVFGVLIVGLDFVVSYCWLLCFGIVVIVLVIVLVCFAFCICLMF